MNIKSVLSQGNVNFISMLRKGGSTLTKDNFPELCEIEPGSTSEYTQCAKFVNNVLKRKFPVYGDAWNQKNVKLVYTGYDSSEKPLSYDKEKVDEYNKSATMKFLKEFNSKQDLDTTKVYTVNMTYKGSGYQERAFNEAETDVVGTHTGWTYWKNTEPDKKGEWRVKHSIDGKIYDDKFTEIQGPNKPWSITTVYEPRERTMLDNIKEIVKKFIKYNENK